MDTTQDNPMTADKVGVGALEALLAKATPGPWAVNPFCAQVDAMPSCLPVCQFLWPTEDRTESETEANAALIAAMRDALPELLRIYRAWQGAAVGTVVAGRANSYGGYHVEVAHEQGWASGTRVRLVPDGVDAQGGA